MRIERDGREERYTYGDLRECALRAAAFLRGKGVEEGSRVALLSDNCPEWGMAYFGIVRTGAAVIPLERDVSEDDVSIAGRVVFRPVYEDKGARMVHVGVAAIHQDREESIRFRARPETNMSGRFVNTGRFAAEQQILARLNHPNIAKFFDVGTTP